MGQLNVQRIGRTTFEECSENAMNILPQYSRGRVDSRRHSYPSQFALVSQ